MSKKDDAIILGVILLIASAIIGGAYAVSWITSPNPHSIQNITITKFYTSSASWGSGQFLLAQNSKGVTFSFEYYCSGVFVLNQTLSIEQNYYGGGWFIVNEPSGC